MGANQSSDAGGGSGQGGARADGQDFKTCYYELLGVDGRASEDEIKKAYRKKALELHPDRNYGNVEQATKQFAEVQSAYEILADPQERAWYDTHRETILRNEDGVSGEHYEHNVRITTAQDITRMFTHFHGTVDFSDSATGFFGRLRETFQTIAAEEKLACEWEGLDMLEYPSFGHAGDKYEDMVKQFYAIWNGFATKKTFSWEDVYRYSEAPDRRVRRMMEKENKRFREEGIREFNDAVRSLVAFVKKRDPRFKPSVQTETERQKVLRDAAVAQAARSRAANKAKNVPETENVPEWMKTSEIPEEHISDEADEAEERVKEQVECVVCKKEFKSEKQYEAHEKSRKHVRAVQHIRRQMQEEDMSINLHGVGKENDTSTAHDLSEESDNVLIHSVRQAVHDDINAAEDVSSGAILMDDAESYEKGGEKPQDGESRMSSTLETSALSSDDEYATREDVEKRILGDDDEDEAVAPNRHDPQDDSFDSSKGSASEFPPKESESNGLPKLGKAKEKRAKKAAQKVVASAGSETEFRCASCQAAFPSKSRLFNHIKDFGHAAPVSKPDKGGKGKNR